MMIGKRAMSSRWNPTVEQLQALEEMYRCGITTPSPQQIQHIAAKLRNFGKIEGKNVFYWFQNHKARDMQKKRRTQFELDTHRIPHPTLSGLNKRPRLEIDHPKKLHPPSNNSTASKNSESTHGSVDQELQKKFSVDVKGRGPENAHPFVALNFWKILGTKNDNSRDLESGMIENKTLELFPIKRSNDDDDDDGDGGSTCRLISSYQFIEFLPTKN